MLRTILKVLAIALVSAGILVIGTIKVIDRMPYQYKDFYQEMDPRLDSLASSYKPTTANATLMVGWARVNITPTASVSLAGYGARDPKTLTGLRDSSYVRTIVFEQGENKVAIVFADLLIIHPELSRAIWGNLPEGWARDEVYFTASHTHSGQGGWAPGIVGKLFAGDFEEQQITNLSQQIISSIMLASQETQQGSISPGEIAIEDLVKNRLAKDNGIIDPWFKVLEVTKGNETGLLTFYSAHATCYGPESTELSGDYPAALTSRLEADTSIAFAAFGAGAVGSMAPQVTDKGQGASEYMANGLSEQLALYRMIGGGQEVAISPQAFQLELPMRAPHFKVNTHLALRPYLFRLAFGDYPHHISVLILGKTILLGMPGDFSGELAVPLYEKARAMGYQLIITSFNGDYAGYILKDEWYDLPKYEASTMSWYGHDAGSYLSEVASRILDIIHENH